MSKNTENNLALKSGLLQSAIVGILSAVGLLFGSNKADANAVYTDTSDSGDGGEEDFSIDTVTPPSENIAILPGDPNFQPDAAFQLPSSSASGEVFPLVVSDNSWNAVPTTLPSQTVAPDDNFAAQPAQITIPPASANAPVNASVIGEEITTASAPAPFSVLAANTPVEPEARSKFYTGIAPDTTTKPQVEDTLYWAVESEQETNLYAAVALDSTVPNPTTPSIETAFSTATTIETIEEPDPVLEADTTDRLPQVALPEVKNEGFVTLAIEAPAESEQNNQKGITPESAPTPLPQPNWNSPSGELLIALETEDEEEDEDEEDEARHSLPAEVPLIAINPDLEEEEEEQETSWLALRAPEEGEEKPTPWLALRAPEEGEESAPTDPKGPSWIALSTPTAEAPTPAILRQPRLALDPEANTPKKRTENWLSISLQEITESDEPEASEDEIALAPTPEPRTYDIDILSQVAITPTYLANGEESEVSVSDSEVQFLSPESGAFLDIPSTPVVLRFPVGAKIALLANGQEVATDLVGRTSTDSNTGLRTQTWYGVSLVPGDNLLEIVATDTGEVLQTLPLVVRGQPASLVLLSPQAVPADGRSTSSIRGQLLDEDGNISLWNSVATVRTSDGEFIGADHDPDVPGFQVQLQEGEFVTELRSSLESQLVQLHARVSGFDAYSQVQFTTPQRPSLLSGVVDVRLGARGTDFYDSYRNFLPLDGDNRYELDVDAAIFATGNLGEWLYTGAYNSTRSLNENCQGESTLFGAGTGTCESYTLYGDDSYTDRLAPSLDSVYLRLERNSPSNERGRDYIMWGDFDTEEFATAAQVFTSTSRQLHGFKANYNFGNLAATALYANNVEGFQRDTIAPDGTSGFYFTSERDIVPGSETVFFELEELERPGSVLERQSLTRGADYEIDYDRGTLLFSEPVARTSVDDFGQLLVRRIVTTYQHEDGSDTDIVAGRLEYEFNGTREQESWVGTSYFTENQGNRDFSLYGVDAQIALGESAQLTAEVARSHNHFDADSVGAGDNNVSGNAYRVELDGSVGKWTGRAHFRTTDAGFSNSATTSFVPGQTRYGAQVAGVIGESTTIRAQYDHEDNFGTAPQIITDVSQLLTGLSTEGRALDNSLTTYSVGVGHRFGNVSAEVDWIHRDRRDRTNALSSVSSDQLRSRLTYPIANNLTLVAQNELNLSSGVDPIYPSRTLIGLDWQAMPWLNVGVNQIFYGGSGNNRGSATSIDVTGEHTFASDTTVRGRFSSVDGRNIGGSIGLEQGINLAPGLDLDLGYEKVFDTFGNQTAASTQVAQSVATGNTASALGLSGGESYHIGLSYTDSADFQGSTRFEHRRSSSGTNTVFNVSAVGRLSPALSILGDYRLAHTANRNVSGLGSTSHLKLGLAYRDPNDDRFNALLRYEYRNNPNTIPTGANLGTSTNTQEHLFSTEAIYTPNWRWELYGKYALRNSSTSVNTTGNSFSNSSTVQLAQARATYRLGYRWDAVAEARWIGGDGYNETGYSVETGYYPLPDLRLSAGYSGGATDADFGDNRSAGGFYVGATAKLGGLFSGFGTQPLAPVQEQESVIEVIDDSAADASAEPTLDLSSLRSDEAADTRDPDESAPVSFDLPASDEASTVNESFPSAVEL